MQAKLRAKVNKLSQRGSSLSSSSSASLSQQQQQQILDERAVEQASSSVWPLLNRIAVTGQTKLLRYCGCIETPYDQYCYIEVCHANTIYNVLVCHTAVILTYIY